MMMMMKRPNKRSSTLTHLFLFKLEKSDSVREQLHVVLGPLFRGTLFREGVADLHGVAPSAAHHIILVCGIVLLLQIVYVMLCHLTFLVHIRLGQVLLVILLLVC